MAALAEGLKIVIIPSSAVLLLVDVVYGYVSRSRTMYARLTADILINETASSKTSLIRMPKPPNEHFSV